MTRYGIVVLCAALSGAGGTASVGAQTFTVQVQASLDNTMFSENSDFANGKGPYLFAGTTAQGHARRGLVSFDLASALPRHAVIMSASLRLYMSRTAGAEHPVSVHRALAFWGEGTSNSGDPGGDGDPAKPGDATWSHRLYSTDRWATLGGDFDPVASASLAVGGVGSYTWSSPGLAADAQAWVDRPASNFGWVLVGAEPGTFSAKRFNSRENTNASRRPVLTVVYACSADISRDGYVTGEDFDRFAELFLAGDPAADANLDGFVTGDDFDRFTEAFVDGC